MFSVNHFIWLGICALIIAGVLLMNKFLKLSFRTNIIILFVVCVLSEFVKTFSSMIKVGSATGLYLDPKDLPFHLCSIQIFFVFALVFFIKSEKTKEILLAFMFPTLLLGGVLAIFIPTLSCSFLKPQVYQYFIYHAYVVGFAIYSVKEKYFTINFMTLLRNLGLLICFMFFGLWINSILSDKGANFLYLTKPPMKGLPILNLDNGWYVYFISLFTTAVVLMSLIHLPFILLKWKKKEA